MKLYPLKFSPIFQYKLWGGDKLNAVLKKECSNHNIGESWEISDVNGNETKVSNGALFGKTLKNIIEEFKNDFLGEKVYKEFGNAFPLLIKFIDAKKPLSIQVHPSNKVAKERHNSFGKNEMWYVIDSDDSAELIVGFDNEIDKEVYKKCISDKKILEVLHHEKVSKGDVFYIPTGRVHAIGSGVLLAEIQQTSDITYRIYDYDRVDVKTGKLRDLHNNLALDVIDFKSHKEYKTQYNTKVNYSNKLVHSPYFKSNILIVENTIEKDYSKLDSFVIYMCVEGSIELLYDEQSYMLTMGETILLPAIVNHLKLNSLEKHSKVLEIYM